MPGLDFWLGLEAPKESDKNNNLCLVLRHAQCFLVLEAKPKETLQPFLRGPLKKHDNLEFKRVLLDKSLSVKVLIEEVPPFPCHKAPLRDETARAPAQRALILTPPLPKNPLVKGLSISPLSASRSQHTGPNFWQQNGKF